jgi:hypothetical protein
VYRSNPLCAASVRCFILASPPMLSSIYLEHQWKMENLIRVSLEDVFSLNNPFASTGLALQETAQRCRNRTDVEQPPRISSPELYFFSAAAALSAMTFLTRLSTAIAAASTV